jgi:hypothetical protein
MTAKLNDLLPRWREAEARLYPVVIVDPPVYERYVSLVRAVADELRSMRHPEDLAGAFEDSSQIVLSGAARVGISAEGLDLDLVAGAAWNLRYREILAEASGKRARGRIREARERGDEWTVVHETGVPSQAAAPFAATYRRLEMRVADGTGLHIFVEPDPDTYEPVYGVEVLRLDPESGDMDEELPAERREFNDAKAWEQAIDDLRRRYSNSSS